MIISDVEITDEQLREAGYKVERIEPELPQRANKGYAIQGNSELYPTDRLYFAKYYENFVLYEKDNLANKAAKLMRRSNAIIMACLLVDPDYEPDWDDMNSNKFAPMYGVGEWVIASVVAYNRHNAYVSTRDKAALVCKLLTEWGVK